MAFTQDGSVVALEQSHRVVKLIEVTTGRNLAQIEAADVPFCRPLCFSRDGSLLATMGGPELLQVWDLRTIRKQLRGMKLDWSASRLRRSPDVPMTYRHRPAIPGTREVPEYDNG